MNRREFITLLGGAAASWPPAAQAQTRVQRPLIGWLGGATAETGSSSVNAFLHGMQALGQIEGRDFEMVYRHTNGEAARYLALAKELVALKPTVIVAISAQPAKQATSTIPIVSATLPADAVQQGIVASVPRPGGNVTGLLVSVEGLAEKQVELAREVVPGATKIGILFNAAGYQMAAQLQDIERASAALNVNVALGKVRAPSDLETAVTTLTEERVQAMIVLQDGLLFSARKRIAALAVTARLPTVYGFREQVEAGGLTSYGIDLRDSFRRAASFVVKILAGAKPGELPLEFPIKLELVINLKTAKALSLELSPILLARADEVIE